MAELCVEGEEAGGGSAAAVAAFCRRASWLRLANRLKWRHRKTGGDGVFKWRGVWRSAGVSYWKGHSRRRQIWLAIPSVCGVAVATWRSNYCAGACGMAWGRRGGCGWAKQAYAFCSFVLATYVASFNPDVAIDGGRIAASASASSTNLVARYQWLVTSAC